MTLTEFLLARISDDEAMLGGGVWTPAREYAQEEPERWRAECEAKRRIVGLCQHGDWSDPDFHSLGEPDERGDVLALLALPYADHPDYDPAWAPTA